MVFVVIPCFKVTRHILDVINQIQEDVDKILIIDDCCPEKSGDFVRDNCKDERVQVFYNKKNMGVGGAVIRGYEEAIKLGATIIIKIDGDGQMDPALIKKFVKPIQEELADYTKGNRFFNIEDLIQMPRMRLFGNAALSIINKMCSGYWNIMDPTNGFTAIHVETLKLIPLGKISKRYFFESDMLFRLNIARAVVKDINMAAKYKDETSHLSIGSVLFSFPQKYYIRFLKRIFYNYFLRDFNIASIAIIFGALLMSFGVAFGAYHWAISIETGKVATTGTIMIPTLSIILGFQFLILFLQTDMASIPKDTIQNN